MKLWNEAESHGLSAGLRAREPLGSPSPPAARRGGAPQPVKELVPVLTLEQKREGYRAAAVEANGGTS